MSAWIPVGIVLLVIVISLPLTPFLWNIGSNVFGPWFDKLGYVVAAGAFMAFIVYMIRRRARFGLSGFILVGILAVVYFGLMKYLCQFPADRIHFAEYGLLAFLLYRAFRPCLHNLKANVLTLMTAGCVGILDECIQYALPNRVFELRDIITNVLAAALGLLLVAVLVPSTPRKVGICS